MTGPKGLAKTFWVVEARDEHHVYSGTGWSRHLAGTATKDHEHDDRTEAEKERDAMIAKGCDQELRVAKRVRHG